MIISSQEQLQKLTQQFSRIMNKYSTGEKRAHDYGIGNRLFRSEVHTIAAIGDHQNINVTELALLLGITKGAVSQVIDKLVKKGFVNKTFAAPGTNEVALTLTEQGLTIHQKHQEYHAKMYSEIAQLLADCSDEQISFLGKIQDIIEEFFDKRFR
ncbi:MarR family transcriptional regulator [Hydrogenispora ethanolica]|uniref:MarR family transcriptional regulator n=1 Tax=Hydrogenispora ethanolica TaxID=1082276 RepID=A0A4R1R2W4_HYDET|nr:MarR family transcriptional regulator [Hydrogenispora ethanolica]TCL59725.1 MarR family transcriptional regulator [Hydrogenispora ethanolica]